MRIWPCAGRVLAAGDRMSPGRPKLPAAQKRTIRHGVAFTPEEMDRMCLIALKLRLSINDYIRVMAIPGGEACISNGRSPSRSVSSSSGSRRGCSAISVAS